MVSQVALWLRASSRQKTAHKPRANSPREHADWSTPARVSKRPPQPRIGSQPHVYSWRVSAIGRKSWSHSPILWIQCGKVLSQPGRRCKGLLRSALQNGANSNMDSDSEAIPEGLYITIMTVSLFITPLIIGLFTKKQIKSLSQNISLLIILLLPQK